jgi:hypothetical protein
MYDTAALARQTTFELEEAYATARAVWRDASADQYARRFHQSAISVLQTYSRALDRLDEALSRAESAAR